MIDVHTHILPGIDDGSKSPQDSIAMLRKEAESGIDEVVLTPHFYSDQNSISKFLERRQRSWDRLQEHLEDGLPALRLGAEVQYFEGICTAQGLEALRLEGSDILLLEMPFSKWSNRMIRDVLYLNSHSGCRILLAHVERYLSFASRDALLELLDDGVLFQSNISFFSRWQTRHKAMSMLNSGMIHALGSDCHDMKYRPPAWDRLPEKAMRLSQERSRQVFAAGLSLGVDEFL